MPPQTQTLTGLRYAAIDDPDVLHLEHSSVNQNRNVAYFAKTLHEPSRVQYVVEAWRPGNEGEVMNEVRALRNEVRQLAGIVAALRERIDERPPLVVRDVTREQAKAEIADLLRAQGQGFPSDISENLQLDYDLVVEVISELQQEGCVELEAHEGHADAL